MHHVFRKLKKGNSSLVCVEGGLDATDVDFAFVKLKGWSNPAPTTALNSRPVKVT